MSTNYYAIPEPCERPCAHCGQSEQHLGHAASGWVFLAKAGDGDVGTVEDPTSLFRVIRRAHQIKDEYGRMVNPQTLIEAIRADARDQRRNEDDVWHESGIDFTEGNFI